jgi:hypothetical protein
MEKFLATSSQPTGIFPSGKVRDFVFGRGKRVFLSVFGNVLCGVCVFLNLVCGCDLGKPDHTPQFFEMKNTPDFD